MKPIPVKDGWDLRLEWKPADCWIGCFWRYHRYEALMSPDLPTIGVFDLWICLLPMLPIHYQQRRLLPGPSTWDTAPRATPVADIQALRDALNKHLPPASPVGDIQALRDALNKHLPPQEEE